jgi:mRNA interferase MazF
LERESQIMVDKLTTVRRVNLGQRLGQVDVKTMTAVGQSIGVFLGMGR